MCFMCISDLLCLLGLNVVGFNEVEGGVVRENTRKVTKSPKSISKTFSKMLYVMNFSFFLSLPLLLSFLTSPSSQSSPPLLSLRLKFLHHGRLIFFLSRIFLIDDCQVNTFFLLLIFVVGFCVFSVYLNFIYLQNLNIQASALPCLSCSKK